MRTSTLSFSRLAVGLAWLGLAMGACGGDGSESMADAVDTSGTDGAVSDDLPGDGDLPPDTDDCGPCDSPPAATCDDAALVTFASPGTCTAGTCSYAETRTTCTLGCDAAACIGDPCEGITCNNPPGACFAPTGTCTSGICSYAPLSGTACDDGDTCTSNDICDAGTCSGTALACETPPPARCLDAARLEVFATIGTCGSGTCTYTATPVTCPGGCANDACVGDPCEGVTCNTPPNACFEAAGTCQNGLCDYAPDNGRTCNDNNACTINDTCQAGTCSGTALACTTPDFGPICADANTRRTPIVPGTCSGNGTCTYATQDTSCAFGCENGTCRGDPCANITCTTPPSPICQGSTLRTPVPNSGACSGGTCTWTFTDTNCVNGCAAGACTAPVGLVISELLYDSTGSPDSDAFLEIHGPPGTSLAGVNIVAINGNGGAIYATIQLSGQLGSDGLFVVAHPNAQPFIADVADLTTTAIDLQNGPDSVQLRFGARILDALAYGTFGTGDIAAGEGQPALRTAVNESLARDHLFTDTDDNLADFRAGVPTPGAPSSSPSICDEDPETILRNGQLYTGTFASAVNLGGRIEICGEVTLTNHDYLPRNLQIYGLSNRAGIRHTSTAFGLRFEDTVTDVHIEGVRIVAHTASSGGQRIAVREANLALVGVEVSGFRGGSAVTATLSNVTVERARFTDNRSGSALYIDRSTASVVDTVFEDNTTSNGSIIGGAVSASLGSTLSCTRCTFNRNSGTHGNGGAAVYIGTTPGATTGIARLTVTDCIWGTGASANTPADVVVWYGGSTTGRVVTSVSGNMTCQASSSGNTCTQL